MAGLFTVGAPAAHAVTWTNNDNANPGGWAYIGANYYANRLTQTSYRIESVFVCMIPNDVNVTELKNLSVVFKGSGGATLATYSVPRVPKNDCRQISVSVQGGSGMTATLRGTININGWVPFPDYDFSFCRRTVVSSSGC